MDSVQILYNGVDAFYPQPTPFVGREEENIYFGERWAQRETITLNGQITGCTFGDVWTGYSNMSEKFRQNYQDLEIWQTQAGVSGRVFLKQLVEIDSINVPDNRWFGAMPYTVTLSCYPSGFFSGAYGILEPVDKWDFTEQQNATMEVRHSVSCRGLNTSKTINNAVDNARGWTAGRTGINSTVYPIFISGVSPANFCLLTQTENIDRVNGLYSVNEVYTNDLSRTGYGVIRYSTSVESGTNLISVNLNGSAQGCGQNLSGIRGAFSRLDKVAIAYKVYQQTFGMIDLNPVPLTQSYNEDPFTTKIDFDYTFNNDNSPAIYFDYAVDLSTALNGNITASIQGDVRVRGGGLAQKLTQALAYADTIDLYSLVLPFYSPFDVSSSVPLNPVPITSGRSINQSDGTVGLNATFSNQNKVSAILDEFNFTLEFNPQVTKVDSRPKLDGLGAYSVVSLGFANRASLSINGTALVNATASSVAGSAATKQACFLLFSQYGRFANATLDVDNITTNRTDDKTLSFSFSWSFDSPFTIGPETVSTLTV